MRPILGLAAALLALPSLAVAQQYDDDYDLDQPAQPQYADPQGDPQYGQPQNGQPQYAEPQADPNYASYGYGYVGHHPIPYQYGSGFCYTDGAHSHEYAPFDEHLFREYNGYYYFIGDPGDFGYTQTVYWFNGNHPIPLGYGGGYCYISWAHRHHYAPGGAIGFSMVGGYYVYTGAWSPDYYARRSFYMGYYGGYYRSCYYGNRYYSVRPPPAYALHSAIRIAAPPGRIFSGVPPAAVYRGARVGVAPAYRGSTTVAPPPAYRGSTTVAPPPAYRGGAYVAPAPAYRGGATVAPPPAYRPAPAFAPSSNNYRVAPAPAYHSSPTYSPSASGFRSAAPPPAYHPASQPAPAFRPAPARVGGFHR